MEMKYMAIPNTPSNYMPCFQGVWSTEKASTLLVIACNRTGTALVLMKIYLVYLR